MGNTPLIAAVDRGDDLEVRNLLSDPATDCEKTNRFGQTAIHLAARRGNAYILNMLLRNPLHRPELNRLDTARGYAPLHYAAAYGCPRCIAVLLEAGADPRIRVAIGSKRAGRMPAALVGKHARWGQRDEDRLRTMLDQAAALAAAQQPPEQRSVEQTRAPAAALPHRTQHRHQQQRVRIRQQQAAGRRTLPSAPPQYSSRPASPQYSRRSAPPQYSRSQAVASPPPYPCNYHYACAFV